MYESDEASTDKLVNTMLLYGKKYIYNCHMNKCNQICINAFAKYFYNKLCTLTKVKNDNNEGHLFLKGFLQTMFNI